MISILTLVALPFLSPTQVADPKSAPQSMLEAVPPSAEVAFVVDDFQALWANAKASAWADVLRAPEFAALWERLAEPFEEEVLPLPDLSAEQALGGFGSVLFYLDGLGRGVASGGMVLKLAPGTSELRESLRKSIAALPEQSTHEGRTLYALEGRSADTAIFEWRDGFAMTGSEESREDTLRCVSELARRLEQGDPDANFALRLGERRTTAKGALEMYVDLRALIASERPTENEDERQLWEAFGFDGVGWAGVRATLGEGVQSDVLGWIDVPSEGLLAHWAACARPAPVELARFAPADAIEVAVLGFDAVSAWRALRAELSETVPTGAKKLQQGLDAAQAALGLDLETQAIEQLSGEFAEILVPVQVQGEPYAWGFGLTPILLAFSGVPGSAPGSAVIVGLRETKPVEHLFEQLVEVSGSGEAIEDEQVGEHWMTSLALEGAPMRPSWAFVDGALIFSLHAEPLRALLRQASKDAPRSWLEEGHRAELSEFQPAACAAAADLQRWLQAEIAVPLSNSIMALQLPPGDIEQESAEESEPTAMEAVGALCRALPGLVDKHLRGTMRNVVWIEGETLRSRFWSY